MQPGSSAAAIRVKFCRAPTKQVVAAARPEAAALAADHVDREAEPEQGVAHRRRLAEVVVPDRRRRALRQHQRRELVRDQRPAADRALGPERPEAALVGVEEAAPEVRQPRRDAGQALPVHLPPDSPAAGSPSTGRAISAAARAGGVNRRGRPAFGQRLIGIMISFR